METGTEATTEGGILPLEARQHYEAFDEAQRLERIGNQVERVRTQELSQRFLPSPATMSGVGSARVSSGILRCPTGVTGVWG